MSLLENLLNNLTGSNKTDFTPPCSLCPGDCPLAPDACTECLPYKEQLREALYNVEHLDDFHARYEIVGTVATGTTTCPYCGAPSENRFVCEYCGMQIAEDDGKIRVASANEIPDPLIQARDLVYERNSKIVEKRTKPEKGGLLSGLLDLLDGDTEDGLGKRMSKEEITEAAKLYDVSVSTYLNGLDNGKYLTLAKKKAADAAQTATGLGGAVTIGGLAGNYTGPRPPMMNRPPVMNHPSMQNRPPMQGRPPIMNNNPFTQQRPVEQSRPAQNRPPMQSDKPSMQSGKPSAGNNPFTQQKPAEQTRPSQNRPPMQSNKPPAGNSPFTQQKPAGQSRPPQNGPAKPDQAQNFPQNHQGPKRKPSSSKGGSRKV